MTRESFMEEVFATPMYGEMKVSVMKKDGSIVLYENVKKASLSGSELSIQTLDEQTKKVSLYEGFRVNGVGPTDHGLSFPTPGCYLTSACVEAENLSDNCVELATLRNFRESYVLSTEEGRLDIEHYYNVAPEIVNKINTLTNSQSVFKELYNTLVVTSVELIKQGELQTAYKLYKDKSIELENTYLN